MSLNRHPMGADAMASYHPVSYTPAPRDRRPGFFVGADVHTKHGLGRVIQKLPSPFTKPSWVVMLRTGKKIIVKEDK